MKFLKLTVLSLSLGLFCNGLVFADGAIVAKVNNQPISQAQHQSAWQKIAEENRVPLEVLKSADVLDDLINMELMAQKSVELGLDQNPAVRNRIEVVLRELLAESYAQYYQQENPMSQSQLEAVYEKEKDTLWPKRLKLWEIIVDQQSIATKIVNEIDSFERFSKLARRYSISDYRDVGGSLGWVKLPAVLEEAQALVATLGEGEWLKKPVEINNRWHIYMLEKIHQPDVQPFEQVSESMQQYAEKQRLSHHVKGLRNEAKIEIFSSPK